MYYTRPPRLLQSISEKLLWSVRTERKQLYLTFDDGPTPGVTDRVLTLLEGFGARATFFCIGGSVQKYPALHSSILEAGHSIGNHTWNHMDGWAFSNFAYFRNILLCKEVIDSSLFRPPYGRITPAQINGLAPHFRIVMWDVLSADWDKRNSGEQCFRRVVNHTRKGSIIVFHDSEKAQKNMFYALPRTLEYFAGRGYTFEALPQAGRLYSEA